MRITRVLLVMAVFLFAIISISLNSKVYAISMDKDTNVYRHGDLPVILEHQSLRVLVAYDNVSFFMNKGKQDGLYVALMNKYVKFIQKSYPNAKNLKVYFIPVAQDQMTHLISKGYGDIAMGISPNEYDKRFVDFTIPEKHWLDEIAVFKKGSKPVFKLEDFAGRFIWVREHSSYYESLKNLNSYLKALNLKPITIIKADDFLTDADLVDMVAKGEILGTIIDTSRLHVWKKMFQNVTFVDQVPLKVNSTLVWAIRHNSKELYRSINRFLRTYGDGTALGKPIYDRYMRTSPTLESRMARTSNEWLGINSDDFMRFKKLFIEYGEKFDIDWMLLMAQGYQESTLNPNARSNRGAVGIMQVLPSTANEWYVNVNSVHELRNNVHAGTKYMRFMIDTYFNNEKIIKSEKLLFALAAYNCGPNRVRKYQRIAKEKGLNPYVWFENVEKIAMENNALETVQYVRNISSLYISYQNAYNLQLKKDKARKNTNTKPTIAPRKDDGKALTTTNSSTKDKANTQKDKKEPQTKPNQTSTKNQTNGVKAKDKDKIENKKPEENKKAKDNKKEKDTTKDSKNVTNKDNNNQKGKDKTHQNLKDNKDTHKDNSKAQEKTKDNQKGKHKPTQTLKDNQKGKDNVKAKDNTKSNTKAQDKAKNQKVTPKNTNDTKAKGKDQTPKTTPKPQDKPKNTTNSKDKKPIPLKDAKNLKNQQNLKNKDLQNSKNKNSLNPKSKK